MMMIRMMNSLSEPVGISFWTSTFVFWTSTLPVVLVGNIWGKRGLEKKTPTPFEKNTGVSHMCPVSVPAGSGFSIWRHFP